MWIRNLLLASALVPLQAGEPLVLLVNPASPVKSVTRAEAADLLKGDSLFLGGKKVQLLLTKPSTRSLPAVVYGLAHMSPANYLALIKQAKMRGVLLDPQFLDSAAAVETAVAGNVQAVGVLLKSEATGAGTRILPIPE